jgi:hypothetical protein
MARPGRAVRGLFDASGVSSGGDKPVKPWYMWLRFTRFAFCRDSYAFKSNGANRIIPVAPLFLREALWKPPFLIWSEVTSVDLCRADSSSQVWPC